MLLGTTLSALSLHCLLVLAILALAAAAWRVAAALAPPGLLRLITAAPLAAAAAAAAAIVLGAVSLGSSPIALSAAAAATWLATRRLLPTPAPGAWSGLARWYRELPQGRRAAFGAVAGALLAFTAWALRYPSLGLDGVVYHLSEVAMWVQQGTPGSRELVIYEYPVTSYPVTNEVLLTWVAGIARGFAVTVVWTPLMLALGIAAAWAGLRELRVPFLAASAAVAAVVLIPVGFDQLRQPSTDVAALAWLACCATLALASHRHPRLLVPAVVAAGLGVGTKATVAPFAVLALLLALLRARGELRRLTGPLAVACALAAVVGGLWYARNLVDHGSPLWPFLAAPWGDPVPPYMARFATSLLERPMATLDGRLGDYEGLLAGAPLLMAGALVAPLLVRSRSVLAAAAAAAGGVLLWAAGPFSGNAQVNPLLDFSLTATRYLLPACAVAALALALAARAGGARGATATALLLGSAGWSAAGVAELGFPRAPSAFTLLAGATAGAALALAAGAVAGRRGRWPRPSRTLATAASAGAVLATGALLAAAEPGFVERHAETPGITSTVAEWAAGRPEFGSGGLEVAFAPASLSVLAGEELEHRLEVIPADEPCERIRGRLGRGWVVVRSDPAKQLMLPFGADECLAGTQPLFDDGAVRVYGSPRTSSARASQAPLRSGAASMIISGSSGIR